MDKQKSKQSKFVRNMFIALVAGILCGLAVVFLRENLIANGGREKWAKINSLLFRDITAQGNERALGLFYIGGQLFIRALQLIIVPMVFTSIIMAINRISDMSQLRRISL